MKKAVTSKIDDKKIKDLCETVLTNIDEAVCVVDSRYKIIYANNSFISYFGQCLGKSFLHVCKGVKNSGKTELEIETKDHNKTFFLIHAPLKLTDKTYFIEELRNITRIKRFEQTLKDYTVKLESEIKRKTEELRKKVADSENARMALLNMMDELNEAYKSLEQDAMAKDELFNITSHELKTPLVPISGFTDMLLKESGNLDPTQKEYLMTIKRNVARLKGMLENIIDIARLQARKADFDISRSDLAEIIFRAIEEVEDLAKAKKMRILKSLSGVKLVCDKEKMQKVFKNLLENSIKFSNPNSSIDISLKRSNSSVIVCITDKGIGISPPDQKKVFEKFYQVNSSLDRDVGGAGLGLPICKAIVEAHDGEIWLDSKLGKGSTFYVKLPLNLKQIRQRKEDVYNENVQQLETEREKLNEERMDIMTQL